MFKITIIEYNDNQRSNMRPFENSRFNERSFNPRFGNRPNDDPQYYERRFRDSRFENRCYNGRDDIPRTIILVGTIMPVERMVSIHGSPTMLITQ